MTHGKKHDATELKDNDVISGPSQGAYFPSKHALDEEVHFQCKGRGSTKVVHLASKTLTTKVNETTSKLSEAASWKVKLLPRQG